MKRAALYIRVSTLEQAEEGYSIGEQKTRLIAYCKAQNWIIADIYVDGGYSGSNLNRPGIQKLMTEINKFDVVLVYKLDRLSRSQRDTLYLIEEVFLPNGVDFTSMQESFDTASPIGKAMIGLLAVFAQLEREQIKERTWMGRVARAKAGLHHGGGRLPIGYDYVDGHLVVNPYEAESVRLIYKWYLEGASFHVISNRLQAEGRRHKWGDFSHWGSIRNILRNDTYLGNYHFGEISMENTHEAIVTQEQFDAAQVLRLKRHEQYVRSYQSCYLLTGLIFCAHCGSRYYHQSLFSVKQGKRYNYDYYTCYSRSKRSKPMIKNPNCHNKNWRTEKLEAIVENKVLELLQSPGMLEDIAASCRTRPELNTEDALIKKRISEIDKRIGKLMELYQNDSIPPELLGNEINLLYSERTTLQASLTTQEVRKTMPLDLARDIVSNAAEVWDMADILQKRRILQTLISRIVLDNEKVEIEWVFQEQ